MTLVMCVNLQPACFHTYYCQFFLSPKAGTHFTSHGEQKIERCIAIVLFCHIYLPPDSTSLSQEILIQAENMVIISEQACDALMILFLRGGLSVVQGYPRSLILVPIESEYTHAPHCQLLLFLIPKADTYFTSR